MFGIGFGGGGGDAYITSMGLLGLDGYVGGLNRAARSWRQLEDSQTKAAGAPSPAAKMMGGGATLFAGAGIAAAGMFRLGQNSVTAYSHMERVREGFITMLGSAQAADAKIKELQAFAAKTPFDFATSAKGAQRLLAMGVAAKDVIPTMRAAGNAVAAAGGDSTTFDRVLLAIGQVQTKGRLMGQELLQMTEAGIPATRILQRELGLTAEQVRRIGEQGIAASVALPALMRGLNKDFGGGMDRLSAKMTGALSNLPDAWERAKTLIGSDISGDVEKGARALTRLIEKFEHLNPELRRMIVYGSAGTVAFAGLAGGALVVAGALTTAWRSVKGVSAAKKGLELITRSETVAERTKSGVALTEAGAITRTGTAATGAAAAKRALRGVTVAETEAAEQAAAKYAKLEVSHRNASRGLSRAMRARDAATTPQEYAKADMQVARYTKARAALKGLRDDAKVALDEANKAASVTPARAGLFTRIRTAAGAPGRWAARTFAGARSVLDRPLVTGGQSMLPGAASRYQGVGYGRYFDTATGKAASRQVVKAWEQDVAQAAAKSRGLSGFLGRTSIGGLVGKAMPFVGGAFQAMDTSKDMQRAGYGRGTSNAVGVAGGVLTAGLLTAAAVPAAMAAAPILAAALPFIIAAGVARMGVNHFYTGPQEGRAVRGNGSTDAEVREAQKAGHHGESARLFNLANQKEGEARDIDNRLFVSWWERERADMLRTEADTFRRNANVQRKIADSEDKKKKEDDARAALTAQVDAATKAAEKANDRKMRIQYAAEGRDWDEEKKNGAVVTNDPNYKRKGMTPGYISTLQRFGYHIPGEKPPLTSKALPGEHNATFNRPGAASAPDTRHEVTPGGEGSFIVRQKGAKYSARAVSNRDDSREINIKLPATPESGLLREAIYGAMAPGV